MSLDLDKLEALHREASTVRDSEPGEPPTCNRCESFYTMDADDEPTPLCDRCAQLFVREVVEALPALLQAARRAATMTSADGVISSLKAMLESLREQRDGARVEANKLWRRAYNFEEMARKFAVEAKELRARLAEVERERDAAKQLIASLEERISDVEDRDDDARMVCEWAATVAAGGTDVRAAARRYLMGEKPPRLAALESLAEDARTCAEWCKHMDVGSGAETGAAARRVLAGIGGK